MKALQSDLFRRMVDAGINVNKHRIMGEPIVFNGVKYVLKTVPSMRVRK